jgi:hypothetical protein
VCLNMLGGLPQPMEFVLTGLDVEARPSWRWPGCARPPAPLRARLVRSTGRTRRQRAGRALLRVHAGATTRRWWPRLLRAAVELALASYPGSRSPARRGRDRTASTGRAGAAEQVEHVVVHRTAGARSCPTAGRPAARAARRRGRVGPDGWTARLDDAVATRREPLGTASAPAPATRAATPTSASGPAPTTPRPGCSRC